MPDLKTIEDHARVASLFAKVRRHGVGLLVGLGLGSGTGYAVKPQTVTVPPPVDITEGGMRCTSIGDQFADGGFMELCRPAGELQVEASDSPPVVSFVVDPKTGKITHRCEQASTGPEVCVPLEHADGGD